jgi:hypothetical protein
MSSNAERVRARRAEFGQLWIAAIEKLGHHFCLYRGDLAPETRDRIDGLARNALAIGGLYASGVLSPSEARATIKAWSDAVRAASEALEPAVLQ